MIWLFFLMVGSVVMIMAMRMGAESPSHNTAAIRIKKDR